MANNIQQTTNDVIQPKKKKNEKGIFERVLDAGWNAGKSVIDYGIKRSDPTKLDNYTNRGKVFKDSFMPSDTTKKKKR